jgi:lipopolysaccharide/colanic/teichoic acid biosynthesis glycosyltransferase
MSFGEPLRRQHGFEELMTEEQINEMVIRRYTKVQSSWGLWQMNLYVQWKRLSWRWVIAGTHFGKRLFDVIGSSLLLVVLSPLFLILALLVKIEDGGPVIFAQTRVGKWGRLFRMLKFRSMCPNAEERLREILVQNQHEDGVTFKIRDDPRMTRFGRWMRRYSLDELPQLVNVLLGDMSLVGPRPPVPREVALYTPGDRRRLEITPGLTCFWQIGGRSEIDFKEQVHLDVLYIESQSFWLDLKILVKTIPAVLTGRGAC